MTIILKREVPTANRSMFGKLVVGSFVVGIMASPFVGRRRMRGCFGDSKVDIAKLTVQKFANEAFPQWRRIYGDRCPHSVYELTEFMDRNETRDPWNQPYRLRCTNDSRFPLIVWSIGEDSIPNTGDDIRSWD